jgi:hypothetical protein
LVSDARQIEAAPDLLGHPSVSGRLAIGQTLLLQIRNRSRKKAMEAEQCRADEL